MNVYCTSGIMLRPPHSFSDLTALSALQGRCHSSHSTAEEAEAERTWRLHEGPAASEWWGQDRTRCDAKAHGFGGRTPRALYPRGPVYLYRAPWFLRTCTSFQPAWWHRASLGQLVGHLPGSLAEVFLSPVWRPFRYLHLKVQALHIFRGDLMTSRL